MRLSLSFAAFAVLCSCSMLFAEDVTRFRGENTQGKYYESGLMDSWPEEGLKPKWIIDDLGEGYGSVIKVQDRLYLTCLDPDDSNKESVVCLDLNGKRIWQQTVGTVWRDSFSVPRVTPTYVAGEKLDEDRLFMLSGNGELYCLAAADGKEIWHKDVGKIYQTRFNSWGVAENVVVKDGKVFVCVGGEKAMAVALKITDGSEVWKTEPFDDKCGYITPILYQNTLIVVTGRHVALVDTGNGQVLWKTNFEEDTGGKPPQWVPTYCSPPIIKGNRFFVSSGYEQGGAMYEILPDGKGAEKLWITKLLGSHHHGMVELDGRIYGSYWLDSNTTGKWCCLDWETGKTIYDEAWGNLGKGVTIFADGKLFLYEERRGTLAIAKPSEKFEIVSSFRFDFGTKEHWAHPVISDGVLYVRHGNSLAAYDIAK